ncbi:MAG: bifunctional GNAT family N-acetyltransferase/carbon-nitrogen hydrolase family protein [Alphaproteobacteria bacterium]|nr:bifunctional GNAT family N-acetyltransferase/carbon-nitrogen hydrolase family protein [Alphaproteobacteria bacterium]
MSKLEKSLLNVRLAKYKDIKDLVALSVSNYDDVAMDAKQIRGQISMFPEGQFVVEYNGQIVGHCATFIIKGNVALKPHTWEEITGYGFASRHDPDGDYLYGMEVSVSKEFRGQRIGQRLYNARKTLCQEFDLKGIVFGGRIPGYGKKHKKVTSAEEYVSLVQEKKFRDPVLGFQLSNDFEVIGVLENYLPSDKESRGYAVHLLWRNPYTHDVTKHSKSKQRGRLPDTVRVATVQFQVRKVTSEKQFEQQLEYFIDVASDYSADFVCFPEMVTLALLSMENERLTPEKSVARITEYTTRYVEFMQQLAISYNINIIGGSHPTRLHDGAIYNVCYVFLRDGSVHTQAKLHPTPNETYWWNIKGGDKLDAIETDCGPIGVQICYDSEFPEPSRYLADQGAMILFVPYCTDERQGHLRVRYCCQARAIENQMYVVTAGVVGNLPDVENMDIHYAESGVFTPCDFPFARDGIAAECAANTEMIAFADLRLESLIMSRNTGTVQNLKDRRFDLYNVAWKKN